MATDIALEQSPDAAESPPQDPDALYEIVDGVRVELPPMSTYSNEIASRVFRKMSNVAEQNGAGSVKMEDLFILDEAERLRRRPDVAFVSIERWPLDRELPAEGDWTVVPDLCVEVTSPHDLFDDVSRKLQEYFRYGVKQVWIVWPPERQVHVYDSLNSRRILNDEDMLSGGELLPGFEMSLAELFRRQPGTPQ
jgi:Uma2 family endonuclease